MFFFFKNPILTGSMVFTKMLFLRKCKWIKGICKRGNFFSKCRYLIFCLELTKKKSCRSFKNNLYMIFCVIYQPKYLEEKFMSYFQFLSFSVVEMHNKVKCKLVLFNDFFRLISINKNYLTYGCFWKAIFPKLGK